MGSSVSADPAAQALACVPHGGVLPAYVAAEGMSLHTWGKKTRSPFTVAKLMYVLDSVARLMYVLDLV